MSTTTANLGLFKYDTTTDANVAFNINNALNNNWDTLDTAVSNKVDLSTLDTAVSNKVDLSGSSSIPVITRYININTEEYPGITDANPEQVTNCITTDNQGKNLGYFYTRYYVNGSSGNQQLETGLRAFYRDYAGAESGESHVITLGYNYSTGEWYTYAPHCNKNSSIVTQRSMSLATNGYLKFGNGVIMQWGSVSVTATGNKTFTYSTSFTGPTTYCITKNYLSSGSGSLADREQSFWSRSGTGATTYQNKDDSATFSWMAIGY